MRASFPIQFKFEAMKGIWPEDPGPGVYTGTAIIPTVDDEPGG